LLDFGLNGKSQAMEWLQTEGKYYF
jgi:hypothetical protein